MVKVVVNGAAGRMGQECVKAITADSELELVGTADVGDDLAEVIKRTGAQVVVEFTSAGAGFTNTLAILKAGAHPVVGTTGFRPEEVRELQTVAAQKKVGGLIAPNFAIGAVLMMKFAREAAKYMPDVEIIELHHDKKADSPSGTAIRTAQMILENRAEKPSRVADHAVIAGARGAELEGINIHAVRLPGLVAHQKVIFGGVGQTLTIQHDSIDRTSFMPGVRFACKKVISLTELKVGLENLM